MKKYGNSEATISNEELEQRLLRIPGVTEGIAQQKRFSRLGELLKGFREDYLGVSQTEASKLVGIPQSELSRIEAGTGVRGPTIATLMSIISAYQANISTSGVKIGISLDVDNGKGKTFHYELNQELLERG